MQLELLGEGLLGHPGQTSLRFLKYNPELVVDTPDGSVARIRLTISREINSTTIDFIPVTTNDRPSRNESQTLSNTSLST
jgi:hypothetical protein